MSTYCINIGTFNIQGWSRVVVLSYARMKARETLSEFTYKAELEREYEKMADFLLKDRNEPHSA